MEEFESETISQVTIEKPKVAQISTERKVLLIILAFVSLSISGSTFYYFVIAMPRNNNERLKIEKQKFDNEIQEKKTQELLNSQNENILRDCLDEADRKYWEYIKLNGHPVPGKFGVYTAPKDLWDHAEQVKQNAINICLKRYGK